MKLNEYVYTTDCDDLNDKTSKLPLKKNFINTTVIGMDGKKRKRKDSTSDTGTQYTIYVIEMCVCVSL